MNISYDWYKIFCYAAECHSITTASERLHISQPAVSQTIRQLEEALGCELFVRTPKGVRLTVEGQALYQSVSKGVAAFSEGEQRLTSMLQLDAGEIKIGASDLTLEFCLLPYLEQFHRQYPNVKITMESSTTPQTLEHFMQGKLDFAAVSEPFSYLIENFSELPIRQETLRRDAFDTIPIREIRDIFICGRNCNIADSVSISDIRDDLILLASNTSTRAFLDSEFHKRGFYVTPKFELATSSQIVNFAARNMGVGCVVADFAQQAIADGKVWEIKVSDPLMVRRICLIRNKEVHSVACDKLVGMILKDHFQ